MVRENHLKYRPDDADVSHGTYALDFLAFSVIMFLSARLSRITAGVRIQTIWRTLAEDATLYFIVIFTSHIVFEMTLIFGRVSVIIQTIPLFHNRRSLTRVASGNHSTYSRRVSRNWRV